MNITLRINTHISKTHMSITHIRSHFPVNDWKAFQKSRPLEGKPFWGKLCAKFLHAEHTSSLLFFLTKYYKHESYTKQTGALMCQAHFGLSAV